MAKIALSPEEKVVRDYHCTQLKFPACDGHLTVTNKRVIFHGKASGSRIVNEVQLDTVNGISSYYGGKFNLLYLILGIGFALFAFSMFGSCSSSSNYYGSSSLDAVSGIIALVCLAVGVFLLIRCYQRVFLLKIFSTAATSAPITIGEGPGGFLSNSTALMSLVAAPTAQTDQMMLELGALIHDLQQLGEEAFERWTKT